MIIDLRQESKDFRKWVEQKATAGLPEQGVSKTIGGIVILFNYDQHGWIALDFNTDEEYHFDGDVSKASWDDLLVCPAWAPFVEAEGATQVTLLEADGTSHSMPAQDITDEFLSERLGMMIVDVLAAAWSDGVFSTLPLRPGLVVLVDDFNGSWGWWVREVSGKLDAMEGPYP